ncbi:30390_t:CDS:2 [Gigaspora margarita]|uniref:30390_t:CDS:1 n=1 Tax=Gigaspora margarita TaxID=4874 RepID=A0ABN7WSD4_GIGMA|nr:30390_t:CDS:2 [Gigaspora margarita]
MVVMEAPLDKVMGMDAMMKGLLELLLKIKPDNCPVDNKSWVDICKVNREVEHEALYNVSKRTINNNEAAGIDNENAKVAEATDEHVEGAEGCLVRSRFENNDMKVRRRMNYASLIGYNYDIKCGRNKNMRPKAQKSFDRKLVVVSNLLNRMGKRGFYE